MNACLIPALGGPDVFAQVGPPESPGQLAPVPAAVRNHPTKACHPGMDVAAFWGEPVENPVLTDLPQKGTLSAMVGSREILRKRLVRVVDVS
jgi:hypothetical protein